MKKIVTSCIITVLATILIPLLITLVSQNISSYEVGYSELSAPEDVHAKEDIITSGGMKAINLEEYIKGVVAAEMPISFEIEALKAQAVAARTYALKRLADSQDINNIYPSQMQGQAYIDNNSLYTLWGEQYNQYYIKLCEAVDSTKDEVLVYQDELIDAVFHSTSAGMTENSENVWKQALPYLVSVESKEDESAPDFLYEKSYSFEEITERLKTVNPNLILQPAELPSALHIIERSEAGYIKLIQIGNIVFTGNDVRVALELRSSNIEFRNAEESIIFTTKGYGHGVGMSQYGANSLAKSGSSYEQILQHYYNGTQLSVSNIISSVN